ncbi:hypothetical protein D3C72_1810320 [compost metagenome]
MLKQQRVSVGSHYKKNGGCGFVQRCLAFKVPGLPSRLEDLQDHGFETVLICLGYLPTLASSRGRELVKLAILEEQAKTGFQQRLEHTAQLFWRFVRLLNSLTYLYLYRSRAVRADGLTNGLLGLEKFVDVSLGKTNGLGEIGDGRFLIAVQPEVLHGGCDDLLAHVVIDWSASRNGVNALSAHGS